MKLNIKLNKITNLKYKIMSKEGKRFGSVGVV
jgi:hypothetical protein